MLSQMLLVFMSAILAVFLFLAILFVGFWMGRHTLEQPVYIETDKTGGQPTFEDDPYADAARPYQGPGGSI